MPGIDYLEDTRRRYLGKRDGFIWYFGAFMPAAGLFSLPSMLKTADVVQWLSTGVWMVFSLAYFSKSRLARSASIPLMLLQLCVDFSRIALGDTVIPTAKPLTQAEMAALVVIISVVFGLGPIVAAYRSPRNRLAFELPVSERDLQRVYDRYLSNPMAVRGAVYSLVAFFIPFASMLTLVMSISAFRRATADAWPPRGGKLPAMLGILVSVLGALAWTVAVSAWIVRPGG